MKPRIFLYLFCFLAVFLALVNAEEKVSVYGLELSLKECVYLALENNDTLKDAYINRKIQKLNFQISEETFFPKIFFSTSGGVSKSTGLDYSFSFNPGGSLKIPTGGSFSFSWANSMSDAGTDYASSMSLSFSQPLLKGMGIDVATASMTKARINEKINILNLKTTITDTVSSIISTYYSLLKAQRAVIDSEEVFQKAQKTLKTSQLLLKMGRIAKVDIFQTEADVANQELAYVAAKASLEEAQTDLLDELELVSTLNVVVKEELELIEPENLDFDYLWSIAQNRPAYQIARLNFEKDKISYIVDKNNQLWDLSLSASISNSGSAANYQQAFTESARFLTEGSWNVLLSTSYD
ncbi:TolC family protein, partial [bacterium]|nr:TolC family protein [bacterium]